MIYEHSAIFKQRYLSLVSKRRQVVYIIKDNPSCAQIWSDKDGYVLVRRLCSCLIMDIDDMIKVVNSDTKPELEFNDDMTLIRISL